MIASDSLKRLPLRGSSVFLWVPAILVACASLIVPLYLVLRATESGDDAVWEVLRRDSTLELLIRSAWFSLAVTASAAIIAVPAAWLTTRTDLPFRRVWAVVLALPLVIPSYVGGFTVVAALGPRGILQDMLEPLGVDRLPEIYGFTGAWLTLTLFTYPYVLLTVQAAFRNVNPGLDEASRGLGSGPLTTFLRITLPQLRPAIIAGSLLVALYTLSDFGAVSLLRFNSFTRVIYIEYQSSFDRTAAAVLSLLLVALTLCVLTLEGLTRGRARYATTRVTRRAPPVQLGHWRWLAVLYCALLALAALGLPLGVITYWLIDGMNTGVSVSVPWSAAWDGFYASFLAAALAVVAALPVAFLAVRSRNPVSSLLERLAYIGFALPGIVVALALVFFAIRVATPFYQTLPLLVAAYVLLFLPQALGAIRTSLLQVAPSAEEAARGLGRSPLFVFRTITLPMIRPGIASGGALVLLTAMKELPATLLLSPTNYRTLATVIWSNANEALFTQASAAAMLLIVVAAIPMAALVILQRDAPR